ncbi:MAG: right-handed parallel beta-helix repeat-containing protein [Paludibacter sp.]|nr:right-handed parallel beta-helix repeat-containing protein [Paludibacter sp.]MDD4198940.1 right-handed parallel beta-helix repeat-containing protein [Paludibacter sp.]MDD4428201.1 right-handed parallel beta-helix repeat-containing protein [Paludibacter sp.]
MKTSNYFFCIVCVLFFLGFISCNEEADLVPGISQPEVSTDAPLKSIANLTIETGMTLAQMNAVIAAASSGQTVYVQPGTYTITGKLTMKNGITLRPVSGTPVFDATANTSQLLEMAYTSNISNCEIIGIAFYNIRYKVTDASNVIFNNCTFDYGVRKAGTDKKYLSDAYIHFLRVNQGEIKYCTFSRRVNKSGRGIYNTGSTGIQITNNTFGNGGSTGYFVTAINDNSTDTYISANTIQRNVSWVNAAETDHGIYTHSFYNMQIVGNNISGWPASEVGGSVKARNGDGLTISNNTFNNSGVMLYTYTHDTQEYLMNVLVSGNTINLAGPPANNIYNGIGYWRNTTSGSEYSIRIENNILPNGTIKADFSSLVASDFNANGGGVFNNDKGAMYLKSGINNSGNY